MAGPSERHRKRHRESTSFADENDRKVDLDRSGGRKITSNDSDEQKLKTFTERDDTLRSIATCKICFRMLYEPYTLGCGHTYCYSCLDQWFRDGERRKPTCPDCRTTVTKPPAPAYLLREMVREMLRHGHLLPDGETVGEHAAHEREEADLVEADKTNTHPQTGGLFKGRFRHDRAMQRPLHDMEDGVMRCPHCTWELEDNEGACLRCGYNMFEDSEDDSWRMDGGLSGGEEDDGDLDDDMDLDDAEFDESFMGPGDIEVGDPVPLGPPLYWRDEASDAGEEDNAFRGARSDEEYNSDEDSSMDGFVADDDEEVNDGSDSESSTSTTRASPQQRVATTNHRRAPRRVIDDDEDEDAETDNHDEDENHDQHGRSIVSHGPADDETSSGESGSEDEHDHRSGGESTSDDVSDADESNDGDSTRSGTTQSDRTVESSSESESEDDNTRPPSGRMFSNRGASNHHPSSARFARRIHAYGPRTQAVR